jgi:serine/threonine protein kinase
MSIAPTEPAGLPSLRFRPVRFHARGGLGEVLVAEDAELRRRVALKRILPEAADAAGARARFLREAEVTGSLEHPGVVPVYGLGRDPSGRPYYAMRFITGRSLKDAVREFHSADFPDEGRRTVAFRKLLGGFVSVCQTMAFAHSRGVIHRDLKPANVMVGEFGETLVVDWGLAKVLPRPDGERSGDGPAEGPPSSAGSDDPTATAAPDADADRDDGRDSTVPMWPRPGGGPADGRADGAAFDGPVITDTAPADLDRAPATAEGVSLGTPGFMSPEQCRGENATVTAATDIYSLGATLYALATGRNPLDHVAPQTMLLFTAMGKVPRPRELNPAVPAALEAVIVKAMALEPRDRYAGAAELAADVEAWLADEPVSAWREPAAVRAGRWVRRHRTAVASAGAALAAVAVALAGGLAVVEGQRRDLARLNGRLDEALTEARAARDVAEAARRRAEEAEADQRAARGEAEAERRRAVGNFRLADASVERLFGTFRTSRELFDDPRLAGLRDRLLGQVAEYSREVRRQAAGTDREFRIALARSALRGAAVEGLLRGGGGPDGTEPAVAELTALLAERPDDLSVAVTLAEARLDLGQRRLEAGDPAGAEPHLRAAEALAARFAEPPDPATDARGGSGRIGDSGDDAAELRIMMGYNRGRAAAHLAELLDARGDAAGAEREYRRASGMFARLSEAHPDWPNLAVAAGQSAFGLARVLLKAGGRDGEAAAILRAAAGRLGERAAARPGAWDIAQQYALLQYQLAKLLPPAEARAAESAYRSAVAALTPAVAAYPLLPRPRRLKARLERELGELLGKAGDMRAAAELYRPSAETFDRLARESPADADLGENSGETFGLLGEALDRLGEKPAAAEAFGRAADAFARLAAGAHPRRVQYLLMTGAARGNQARQQSWFDVRAAAESYDSAVESIETAIRLDPAVPDGAHSLFAAVASRATVREVCGRYEDAKADWTRLADLAEAAGRSPIPLSAEFLRNCATFAGMFRDAERGIPSFDKAVAGGPITALSGPVLIVAARQAVLESAALAKLKEAKPEVRAKIARLDETAVALLKRAVELGQPDFHLIPQDKAFERVRSREDYRAVISDWKARLAARPDPPPPQPPPQAQPAQPAQPGRPAQPDPSGGSDGRSGRTDP